MILYHGSTIDIEEIDLNKSKPNKDFGRGFYLSAEKQQALEMASFKAELLEQDAILNVYEFEECHLSDSSLKVKIFDNYDEEWADFIFANRNNEAPTPVHDYDIVIGPIANDRVGLQIRKLVEQEIDFATFLERLKYMKGITFQYFFGTERAIRLLKKV